MYWLMSESETYLTVTGSKLIWTVGFTGSGSIGRVWPTVGLNRSVYRQPYCPHQGWPSGHSHFTREEVSVGFQCHAEVTLATTLLNPCPPHPASLITSIHYPSLPFPPPLISSCHHGPVRSQTVRTLFHCCKCHLSYTLSCFPQTALYSPPFFKKRPLLTFHVFSFLLRAREPFSSPFTQPCPYILSVSDRIPFPASYFCFVISTPDFLHSTAQVNWRFLVNLILN